MSKTWENNEEIEIFREYVRIKSVHPDIDYGKKLLKKYLKLFNDFYFFKINRAMCWIFKTSSS